MPEGAALSRVRGTNDFVPPEAATLRLLEERLQRHLALYGYAPIATPVLETTDLFLRKSGEEIATRMYAFTHWNRRLCLRPEFTASVIRAYVQHLQDRPLPLRLTYSGPTFRYEKPQRGRYRQFTEVGGELLGAAGPAADAEVLQVACGALESVGVRGYRLTVGHLGVALQMLAHLGIDERGQALIVGQLEPLARKQAEPEAVVERVALLLGAPAANGSDEDGAMSELLAQVGPEAAEQLATELLLHASLPLDGGVRSPAEIVQRLLAKAARPDPTPQVRTAVEFLQQLHGLAGPPAEALGQLEEHLREYGIDPAPLAEIHAALELFARYGARPAEVVVDLSLARGLRYYTGLVFEIYDDGPDGPLQLCGGGRYDDLVRALGGRDAVSACGFSIGLERAKLALERHAALPALEPTVQAVVVPIETADQGAAIEAAQVLRARGVRAELDLRARGVTAALRHADRAAIPLVVIMGERERTSGTVVLCELAAHAKRSLPVTELADAALAVLGAGHDRPAAEAAADGWRRETRDE